MAVVALAFAGALVAVGSAHFHTQTQKDELLLFTLLSHLPLAITTSLCPVLPPPILQVLSFCSLCLLHDSSSSWNGIACGQMVA